MKRLSLFTLLLFLCIATLEAAPRQITVWHSYRGAEETAINGLAEEFNALHRDDIRVTLLAVPYDAFANKITSAVPRGNGPDAFIYAHERIGDWAASGIIEP
ncbi:MAG TPA: extracellular solute-binding protein, partial [bacterium]|nr:extracellular solute-binding protein [bacterium]